MNDLKVKVAMDKAQQVMSAPPSIEMRLARPTDAEYIYSLRIDPQFNQHLSAAPPSVEAQAKFLEGYVTREAQGLEYYFIVKNKLTGADCGTVRIYDLREDSFCWGSWILDSDKPRLAALESALFIYDFGFGVLGYPASHFDVRKENTRVIAFHERFGAQRVSEDDIDVFFKLRREDLGAKLGDLMATSSYSPVFLTA
ncbi:GNAT family N-acetyltransferase [Massilia alkalitolerans]|uniref:GNAT family N-acetyltransferase n=1 Tax=Massilia alkalitolerans TaxID=286638 RepID=UPI001B7FB5EE|nr:GNAT family N-acetyltransferase [Massilia alkalitolerans]